jgi:hypothetical protein
MFLVLKRWQVTVGGVAETSVWRLISADPICAV